MPVLCQIDTEQYLHLAAAIAPCAITTCDIQASTTFFTDYISDASEKMSDDLLAFFSPWKTIFANIGSSVEDLGNDLGTLAAKLPDAKERIKRALEDICAGTACDLPSIDIVGANVRCRQRCLWCS